MLNICRNGLENEGNNFPETSKISIIPSCDTQKTLQCLRGANVDWIYSLKQEEIKSRLNSGTAFYRSVLNILSSRFLYKNLKIVIYETIILHVFCVDLKLGLSL
jgi:hypothetical protein